MTRSIGILVMIFCPTVLRAQDIVPGWAGLDATNLSTVYVLDDQGSETAGRLIRLDDDAIVLRVDGNERRFEAARVRRIDKHGDSLKNGAILGALVGLAMGILTANIADCVDDEGRAGGCGAGAKVAFVGVSTGIYAGIGTGIDAIFTGRTRLYDAPVGPEIVHWERVAGPQLARQVLLNLSFSW